MRIEHANITVKNVDTSLDFYHRVFGFEKRWEGQATGSKGPIRAMHIGDDATYLSVFEADKAGEIASDYGVPGFNHLGFVVEDVETIAENLIKNGYKRDYPKQVEKYRIRDYFADADGNQF